MKPIEKKRKKTKNRTPPFPVAKADELQVFRLMPVSAAIFQNARVAEVRVAITHDGKPLFVLSDLAQMVGMNKAAGGTYMREKMEETKHTKGAENDLFFVMQGFTGSVAAHRPLVVCSVFAVALLINMDHRSPARQQACRSLPAYICAWLHKLRADLGLKVGEPIPPLFPPTPRLKAVELMEIDS